jgi:HSP20 family protein
MSLVGWDSLRALRQDWADDLADFFRRPTFEDGEVPEPAADVSEADDEVTVRMEVPGVDGDDLQVTVFDDRVTVRGEARGNSEDKGQRYYRQEIPYGAFQRTVALPVEVDGSRASAKLENGILSISLPKSTQPKGRSIEVG